MDRKLYRDMSNPRTLLCYDPCMDLDDWKDSVCSDALRHQICEQLCNTFNTNRFMPGAYGNYDVFVKYIADSVKDIVNTGRCIPIVRPIPIFNPSPASEPVPEEPPANCQRGQFDDPSPLWLLLLLGLLPIGNLARLGVVGATILAVELTEEQSNHYNQPDAGVN